MSTTSGREFATAETHCHTFHATNVYPGIGVLLRIHEQAVIIIAG